MCSQYKKRFFIIQTKKVKIDEILADGEYQILRVVEANLKLGLNAYKCESKG